MRGLALAFLCAACGTDGSRSEFQAVVAGLAPIGEQPSPRALAEAARRSIEGPVLLVVRPDLGVAVTAVPEGGGVDGFEQWTTLEGQALILNGGELRATRGLGHDLMASEVSADLTSARVSGQRDRQMAYLGDDEAVRRTAYSCQVQSGAPAQVDLLSGRRAQLVQVTETCNGDGGQFANEYWLDGTGAVQASRQWVSEPVGYLEFEFLSGVEDG